jgi:hypothetical protein
MTRYVPARHYIFFGGALLALAAFSAWLGFTLTRGLLIPAGLFLLVSAVLLALAFRPAIRVYDAHI